ncbi:hypothetical protein GC090_20255 (plasmid) [Pantoea sp. JZ29]|uniref:hypothetical protein n=1 Tax=Pantoea sp. JZ29 TaxID=2654192 RepID=UPI002B470585|nr:hypothetical protein [Pantoea sp. JZ29]WRH23000.1 hypothetical protein GC090_20255 [Pantoea sp. JZ29]
MMKKTLPPIGISHTTHSIEDLYHEKLKGKSQLVFHPAAQPNSYPHFGTVTSLISTFALAKKLKENCGTESKVLFWELENAPGDTCEIDGSIFYRTLGKSPCNDYDSKSEKHLKEFRNLLKIFSDISGIPYNSWSYNDFQSTPEVREIIINLIEREDELATLLCPSEKKFKVRFACPVCDFAEKTGGKYAGKSTDGGRIYECSCPLHGSYEGLLSVNNTDLFDINTPVRALAREIYYIYKMKKADGQNMMSDGADWVQYATLNMEALIRYGIPVEDHPLRFFSPVILDEFGAKLAKSAQIGSDRYAHLPKYNVDSTCLEHTFGSDIYYRLWKEVSGWLEHPRKVFRNYTVKYFEELLGH